MCKLIELFQYSFMQRAFLSATLIGILCAVIGVYVVLRGMSFVGSGIAHSSMGGIALGLLLNMTPFFTAILFCTGTAWAIGYVSERGRMREDAAVGIFFAASMALGVLFIGLRNSYNADLFGYIFGNILAVTSFDVWMTVLLFVLVVGIIIFLFKEFLYLTFDQEMARIAGLPVRFLNYLMLTLIAFTVVMSIKAVGIVLVSALIVTPAAAAQQLTLDLKKMMWLSVVFGVVASWMGLLLSAWFDIASGATIVLTATLIFLLSLFLSPRRRKAQHNIARLEKQITGEP